MFEIGQSVYLVSPFYSEKAFRISKGQIVKGYILKAEHPRYFVNVYPFYAYWYSYYDLIECD
jgi:hypothetical protein